MKEEEERFRARPGYQSLFKSHSGVGVGLLGTWVFEQRCEINSNVSEIPTNCQRFMYVYNSLLNTSFLLCPYCLLISPSCPRGPHPV